MVPNEVRTRFVKLFLNECVVEITVPQSFNCRATAARSVHGNTRKNKTTPANYCMNHPAQDFNTDGKSGENHNLYTRYSQTSSGVYCVYL